MQRQDWAVRAGVVRGVRQAGASRLQTQLGEVQERSTQHITVGADQELSEKELRVLTLTINSIVRTITTVSGSLRSSGTRP